MLFLNMVCLTVAFANRGKYSCLPSNENGKGDVSTIVHVDVRGELKWGGGVISWGEDRVG
jgi:hypothetical protein